MVQLHQDMDKFEEKKMKVVAVCPENAQGIQKYLEKEPLAFDLVADHTHVLAKEYGQKVNFFKLGRMPAQIVLDEKQQVVFVHFSNSMADIVDNQHILDQF